MEVNVHGFKSQPLVVAPFLVALRLSRALNEAPSGVKPTQDLNRGCSAVPKKGSEEPGDIVLQCFMLLPEETEICLQGHWILLHKKKTLLGEESACFHFSPKRSNVP